MSKEEQQTKRESATGSLAKFLPGGEFGPMTNRQEYEQRVNALPPEQREFAEESTRFADIDPQWHLNNVRVAEFYQEGRISFNRALSKEFQLEREQGRRILVARQSLDYLAGYCSPSTWRSLPISSPCR